MHVLCTGGLGYIGSHTVVQLVEQGHKVCILDSCANSSVVVIERIAQITKKPDAVSFVKMDLLDGAGVAVKELFEQHKFDGVIHFAGLKAVGESCTMPLEYYHNNITGTLFLLQAMRAAGVKKIVFSSSATVYQPCDTPLDEDKPLGPSNPYGQTKFMIEQILKDLFESDKAFAISILRYFNPVGAHPSGLIGENPSGPPNNLMPFIQQVGVGRREKLTVFGTDYDTIDGTGVRDYLHVDDIASAHLRALEYLTEKHAGCFVHNLGTGQGQSVLQMKNAFEKASDVGASSIPGKEIPYTMGPRRPGDLASVVADPTRVQQDFGWKATRSLEEIHASAWKWQSENPYGYEPAPQKGA